MPRPDAVSPPVSVDRDALRQHYQRVRRLSHQLCEPLQTEDFVIQSMPDTSPTKWHLAHVTWFFEAVVLESAAVAYRPFHPAYAYLFNSYYTSLGERHCRPDRGLLSRPTVQAIFDYRAHVDSAMQRLLEDADAAELERLAPLIEIGLHHEQQHQELLLMDIKHAFSTNPLAPAYHNARLPERGAPVPKRTWHDLPTGVQEIGHDGDAFAFDNESPRHRVYLEPAAIAGHLVTEGEYLAFMEDGGYNEPRHWLSDGWAWRQEHHADAPLYWFSDGDGWRIFTLSGLQPLAPSRPLCHVSYYEADAYARWAGGRLPTEAEWEVAASAGARPGTFLEDGWLHPIPLHDDDARAAPAQLFGDVWEWTSSHYSPYPGFQPLPGPLGEYNGKFMANQFVLRGGSCATPRSHIRTTYRNFFSAAARWPFTGIRLATYR